MSQWVLENMIKHGGFREESEWRIVVADPPPTLLSFHGCPTGIKASVYIKRHNSPDPRLPLKEIIYGPTLREDTQQVVKWMLEKYGYPEVEVKPSVIPYRQ